jgi:hypothetical protein
MVSGWSLRARTRARSHSITSRFGWFITACQHSECAVSRRSSLSTTASTPPFRHIPRLYNGPPSPWRALCTYSIVSKRRLGRFFGIKGDRSRSTHPGEKFHRSRYRRLCGHHGNQLPFIAQGLQFRHQLHQRGLGCVYVLHLIEIKLAIRQQLGVDVISVSPQALQRCAFFGGNPA